MEDPVNLATIGTVARKRKLDIDEAFQASKRRANDIRREAEESYQRQIADLGAQLSELRQKYELERDETITAAQQKYDRQVQHCLEKERESLAACSAARDDARTQAATLDETAKRDRDRKNIELSAKFWRKPFPFSFLLCGRKKHTREHHTCDTENWRRHSHPRSRSLLFLRRDHYHQRHQRGLCRVRDSAF